MTSNTDKPVETAPPASSVRHARSETRRSYVRPALVEYGPVAKLTQGSLTVANDGPMGGHRMMMCL